MATCLLLQSLEGVNQDETSSAVSEMTFEGAWKVWPSAVKVTIPLLADHSSFDLTWGLEKEDIRWKESLISAVEKGKVNLPGRMPTRKEASHKIDLVTSRTYHIARMIQTRFDNPCHDNYTNPFLETIYIALSQRGRIDCAKELMAEIVKVFPQPCQIADEENLPLLAQTIERAGLVRNRTRAIFNTVQAFMYKFPDGDFSSIVEWKDSKIESFLEEIPGIGKKEALCVMMYSLGRRRFPIDQHAGRILIRTQMLRELVHLDETMDHKTIQLIAEFAVPPSVRIPLHAGLVSLGQTYCHNKKPKCKMCPLGKTCEYNRAILRKKALDKPYTHVDLFCGAGGISAGFSSEGFRTVLAVDNEPAACQTFTLNHPEMPETNVLCEDLEHRRPHTIIKKCYAWERDLLPGKVDVLTAGIPCQGFSKAGYRSRPLEKYDAMDDPRNHLYKRVILWIKELRPRYVVLENVPEIRSAGTKDHRILDAIKKEINKLGYKVDHGYVNAAEHGTPQIRYRMILIASAPEVDEVKVVDLGKLSKKGASLQQAIGDLPPIAAGEGSWYCRTASGVVSGHIARFNNEDDLKIFAALAPGEHYEDFIIRRKDIMEERAKGKKRAVYGTKSFSDKYFRLRPDEPSRTIVAHLNRDGNGYIHPQQVRSITPREAMRLQGFEDDYVFCGSLKKQFIQVGNAVPPPLARNIAKLLALHLYGKISPMINS